MDDRLAMRKSPAASPIMYQSWGKLLFMHWPMRVEALRPLIPARLAIDTFEGNAWVGLTPFTIWNARPVFMPPLPWLSNFHEINVRTYVHLEGAPGVWFFSLDASSLAAVIGARTIFHLPYYHADISLKQQDNTIIYRTTRHQKAPKAAFSAIWTIGAGLPPPEPDSLEFFLVERYCLYASDKAKLFRCRIHHQPWPLQKAHITNCQSTMLQANQLPAPPGEPLLHSAGPVHVQVWPLEEV